MRCLFERKKVTLNLTVSLLKNETERKPMINPMHPEKTEEMSRWQGALKKANQASRCGAKSRKGTPCRSPAMKNGRCRMHGGKSTGAPLGVRHGRYRQGLYTKEAQQENMQIRAVLEDSKALLRRVSQLF